MKLRDFFSKNKKSNDNSPKSYLRQAMATRSNVYGYGGLSSMLPNPDPVLRKMGKETQSYEEILTDPHLYGCIQSRKAGVLSLEWKIASPYGSENISVSAEIEKIFNKLDIEDITRQILDAPLFGFQPLEIVWQFDGQYFVPDSISAKPKDWFFFDNDNNLKLRTIGNWAGEAVNQDKFLLPRHEADYNNPYGVALLSKCYWNVMFKKQSKKFWAAFTEKFGMPWVLGKYLSSTDQNTADEIMSALINMFNDGIIVYPDNLNIELLQGHGSVSADVYEKLINDCRVENSILILGHAGASLSTPGKLGNELIADKATKRIIDSDKRLVQKTFNQLIALICKFNFNTEEIPLFNFYEDENINRELAERDKILKEMGVNFSKEYYASAYRLNDDLFEIIGT